MSTIFLWVLIMGSDHWQRHPMPDMKSCQIAKMKMDIPAGPLMYCGTDKWVWNS